jgi:hypothetical protein
MTMKKCVIIFVPGRGTFLLCWMGKRKCKCPSWNPEINVIHLSHNLRLGVNKLACFGLCNDAIQVRLMWNTLACLRKNKTYAQKLYNVCPWPSVKASAMVCGSLWPTVSDKNVIKIFNLSLMFCLQNKLACFSQLQQLILSQHKRLNGDILTF